MNKVKKLSKQPIPASTAGTVGTCPTIIRISRTPRHRKLPNISEAGLTKFILNEVRALFLEHVLPFAAT